MRTELIELAAVDAERLRRSLWAAHQNASRRHKPKLSAALEAATALASSLQEIEQSATGYVDPAVKRLRRLRLAEMS